MSVLNILRYSSKEILRKSLKTKSCSSGTYCWITTQNQKYKSIQTSTPISTQSWAPICSISNDIQSKPQSSLVPSRSMSSDHSHSKLWTIERFVSAGLLGLMPLALAVPNPALDYALALALTVHVHWGIEAIAVDYLRPSVVGATLSKAATGGVYVLTILTLGGLFYFNYSDVGLCQAIRMLWKL